MPIIAEFKGIKIYMNYSMDEHNPPHIHGVYDNKRCSIDLNGNILDGGRMSKRMLNDITKFVLDHKQELESMWLNQKFPKII